MTIQIIEYYPLNKMWVIHFILYWCISSGIISNCENTSDIFLTALTHAQVEPDNEEQARAWLEIYNEDAQTEYPKAVEAEWNYNTNLTDENLEITVNIIKFYQSVLV